MLREEVRSGMLMQSGETRWLTFWGFGVPTRAVRLSLGRLRMLDEIQALHKSCGVLTSQRFFFPLFYCIDVGP